VVVFVNTVMKRGFRNVMEFRDQLSDYHIFSDDSTVGKVPLRRPTKKW
jgi:hypothetical protein